MLIATRTRAVLSGILAAASVAVFSPALAQAPSVLTPGDRLSYTSAFDALRRGQLDQAREVARQIRDRVLLGRLEFERLFHPDHRASYEELTAWLGEYADMPQAGRVYTLALRRRPADAPPPPLPRSSGLRDWASVQAAAGALEAPPEPPAPRAARVALNDSDLPRAYALGVQTGDWWTAGLAAWRQGDYGHSFSAFERVAVDPTEDVWVRAGGAVWAARATVAAGRPDRAQEFLRLATRWPATFYGQIALAQLGQEAVIENLGPQPYLAVTARDEAAAPALPGGLTTEDLAVFIRDDAQARRAVAFSELEMWSDARETLREGIRAAPTDEARRLWAGLAESLGPRITGPSDGAIDARNYPIPVLEPEGGFTIERALVYAIARKESGFEPTARSSVGAYGVMQVMPTTAAELADDRGFISNPERLWNPATNLRLGQMYIQRMLNMGPFQGDVLRAVASYNAGPGPMLGALRKLGPDADALLLIETIDVPQARQYVEEVMAAYWIYQRIFGGELNTLAAVASGARLAPLYLDRAQPAQVAAAAAAPATP